MMTIACDLVRDCADQGADLVVLPENGLHLGTNQEMRDAALSLNSPEFNTLSAAAKAASTAVLMGGFKRITADDSIRNSAALFDARGDLVALYDKIHLFDARINGQSFEASSVEQAGATPVIVEFGDVKIGVTICYDVRFPELYRQLALNGAEVLLIPAAFTQTTGAAHWEPLLRARAIENACYVVASATVRGDDGTDAFETYGHAMVIDPWGNVVADLQTASPVSQVVELDLDLVQSTRQRLPVLHQVRPHAYAAPPCLVAVHPALGH